MLNHETIERLSAALTAHESLVHMRDVSLQNSGHQFTLCVRSALPGDDCVHHSVKLVTAEARAVLDTAISRSNEQLCMIVDELQENRREFVAV